MRIFPLLLFAFLLPAVLSAQTPANFSGTWILDKSASTADLVDVKYDGTVIRQVQQNASTISLYELWQKPGENDFKTASETYKLDGKVRIRKDAIGVRRDSVRWSQEKKALTIIRIDTQPLKGTPQEFLVEDTYTLSADGKTLTVDEYSRNPVTHETKVKRVYTKKGK